LWQVTQLPVLSHAMPEPHVVPGPLLPLSVQTWVPVEQENVPTLQELPG